MTYTNSISPAQEEKRALPSVEVSIKGFGHMTVAGRERCIF